VALDAGEQKLFEALRACRSELAKKAGMPPYVIAHDRTLADMAKKRPQTRDALLDVHGMGPHRAEQYGDRFLRVLADA
jgi:ATP-dependent DNA helicase RecQ